MAASGLENFLVFVPNTYGPYGYEMVSILAYPKGFNFRFRFDEKWVDEKVKNRLKDAIGSNGYILLRDFETSNLYPIRYLTLRSARKVGPIYYFECELNDMMDIGADNVRPAQFEMFRRRFDEFHPDIAKANTAHAHLTPLVFLTNFFPDLRNEAYVEVETEDPDSARWMNIVASTMSMEHFDKVQFLRILTLSEHSKRSGQPPIRDGAWSLEEGATYTMHVVQFTPKGNSPRDVANDIVIKADEVVIKVVRGVQRAVGKYDILRFVIRVKTPARSTFSFIDIEFSQCPDLQGKIEPRISIPIQIRRSGRRILYRIAFAVFFGILYFFPNSATYVPSISEDMIKDLGILGLAVTVVDLIHYLKRRNTH